MIELVLDTIVAALGETVRGQVQWDPNAKPPDAVVVELGFHTEGRGSEDRGVVAGTERTFAGDPTTIAPWLQFELTIPHDAPVSYDGNLIRVLWWVEARLDVPWARDPKASESIQVLPKGV